MQVAMVRFLATLIVSTALVAAASPARSGACPPDGSASFVCGEGKEVFRVFADTVSPSKAFAFAWRSSAGLPRGDGEPGGDIENLLVRLADGKVLARLGGQYWSTGEMRANRYDLGAIWSADSRTVVEIANGRWDTESFACYRIGDGEAAVINLLALIEPVLMAKLPAARRGSYSLRVRSDLPVKLDARGRLQFLVALFVPKSEDGLAFRVDMALGPASGRPAARVVSVQRTKIDPRL